MKSQVQRYSVGFAHGLMFHRFHREGQYPTGQGSLTAKQFVAILEYVGVKNILTPEQWLTKLKLNRLARRDICLTFDDGLRCQFDVCLPVLERYGLKAFWFIFSAVIEGQINKTEVYQFFAARYFRQYDDFYNLFLSRCPKAILAALKGKRFLSYAKEKQSLFPFYSLNDLRYRFVRNNLLSSEGFELILDAMVKEQGTTTEILGKKLWMTQLQLEKLVATGHCLGLHSYTHPFMMAKLPYNIQKNEYERNYEHIHRLVGQNVLSVSHPLNSYNSTTLKILHKLGIICGFRSNVSAPHGKTINPTGLELAREDATNIIRI